MLWSFNIVDLLLTHQGLRHFSNFCLTFQYVAPLGKLLKDQSLQKNFLQPEVVFLCGDIKDPLAPTGWRVPKFFIFVGISISYFYLLWMYCMIRETGYVKKLISSPSPLPMTIWSKNLVAELYLKKKFSPKNLYY